MKTDCTAIEETIVRVRCIGQMLTMIGEGMHTQKDPNGEAIVHLGMDLLDAPEKLTPAIDDLMAYERHSKVDAA
jgi:hypothetical protein